MLEKSIIFAIDLYNGKELVESPTYEYNVYDYGFRGYYATIGRFTSMDPLAEKTPWQSPYVYAGNNFINSTDWMGLEEDNENLETEEQSEKTENKEEEEGISIPNCIAAEVGISWQIIYEEGIVLPEIEVTAPFPHRYEGATFGTISPEFPEIRMVEIKQAEPQSTSSSSESNFSWSTGTVLGYGATAFGTYGIAEVNPVTWIGKNDQVYSRSMRYGKGLSAFNINNSYKAAIKRSGRSFSGIVGTSLSGILSVYYLGDMIVNGATWEKGINLGVSVLGTVGGIAAIGWLGATAVVAAPWILSAVTIYGLYDVYVGVKTGGKMSAADQIVNTVDNMIYKYSH